MTLSMPNRADFNIGVDDALTLTLIVMSAATTLLATSLRTRPRKQELRGGRSQRLSHDVSRDRNSVYVRRQRIAAAILQRVNRVLADLTIIVIGCVDETFATCFSLTQDIVLYSPLPARINHTVMAYDFTSCNNYFDAMVWQFCSYNTNDERVTVESASRFLRPEEYLHQSGIGFRCACETPKYFGAVSSDCLRVHQCKQRTESNTSDRMSAEPRSS